MNLCCTGVTIATSEGIFYGEPCGWTTRLVGGTFDPQAWACPVCGGDVEEADEGTLVTPP